MKTDELSAELQKCREANADLLAQLKKSYSRERLEDLCRQAIGLYHEYVDKHGASGSDAIEKAMIEIQEGLDSEQGASP